MNDWTPNRGISTDVARTTLLLNIITVDCNVQLDNKQGNQYFFENVF